MNFILHEIKLWFKKEGVAPKNYEFVPGKINVVTGDATTGKSSFWSIIDYCLLSGKVNIPNTIYEKVEWFGIRFTLKQKEVSIIRRSPNNGGVAAEVLYGEGSFPEKFENITQVAKVKALLDQEFAITDSLRFPYGKESSKVSFNLSYRHFLIFNALTETVIGAPETYFDTTFFGREEFDNALKHVFDLVIGVNDMENIKANERLKEIENELKKIQSQAKTNEAKAKQFDSDVYSIFGKCKQHNFIEYSQVYESLDEALALINEVIQNTKATAANENLFSELDALNRQKNLLQANINAVTQYQKEFADYRKNLTKSADSLQPIQFLNQHLSEQLVDSYETKLFLDELETSLTGIKDSLSKNLAAPPKVSDDLNEFRSQLHAVNKRIEDLNVVHKNFVAQGQKFIALGEIKYQFEQILKREQPKPIDAERLNNLNDEKERLLKVPIEASQLKRSMQTLLNESIQRNFNLLSSLPAYKNSRVDFNTDRMILQLYPNEQLFPLDNVGSKSNYMFMHLCVYLGLHEHVINIQQEHVPQFLFIDQPSIPYYAGDNQKGNDDRSKLLDAFSLLNDFVQYISEVKKKSFQIFMVEHAPKEYWEQSNLTNFHTVDEFINGNGLIPQHIYND